MQMQAQAVWNSHLFLSLLHCSSASYLQGKWLVLWVDGGGGGGVGGDGGADNMGKYMTQQASGVAGGGLRQWQLWDGGWVVVSCEWVAVGVKAIKFVFVVRYSDWCP